MQNVNVYNTTLLKDAGKLEEFKINLCNRFEVLQDTLEEGTVEGKWEGI